ncbi:polysaccharide deacetylase family protein [Martelella radicis]|uniref:Chitooligosaccharide deacetylase n=1 Tax=Martelella radicis TaxID=1397476 RepID=A0A7W6KKL6_9HYPH|nr:polysaccharide deacetylase family protein [Martelella radicis]MBB4121879.1 peptidoglycan/xylan/chitin deacetylase (PgdA/CDA1 family) [Martelella radicis]
MHRLLNGLFGLGVLALASCASTGQRDTTTLQTALVATEKPAEAGSGSPAAIEVMMTGSIDRNTSSEEAPVKISSIHSRIVAGADAESVKRTIRLVANGPVKDFPLAGRTIYLDETRDITLAPGEVVLTFDDGPVPGKTPAVLQALEERGVKGLFFMVGEMAHYHPQIAEQVVESGQTIGTHTYSHPHLPALSLSNAVANIDRGAHAVEKATGVKPHFFRFPYLAETTSLDKALQSRGMIPVGIDIDSRDYEEASTSVLVNRIMTGLAKRGGGIVLMHDLQGRTARAIVPLLDRLETEGYKVVTVKYGKPPEEKPETLMARLSRASE